MNYIEELKKCGLSNIEIMFHTGKSLPTVNRHKNKPEELAKLEVRGYEKLIEMAKAGELK